MPIPISPAQARTEWLGGLTLSGLILLTTCLPAVHWITGAHDTLRILHVLGVPLVWAFYFRLFGWHRMRRGMAVLLRNDAAPDFPTEAVEAYLRGLISLHKLPLPLTAHLGITYPEGEGPSLTAELRGAEGQYTLDLEERLALLDLVTGDGDAYRYLAIGHRSIVFAAPDSPAPRHHVMADIAAYEKARDVSRALRNF